MIKYTPAVPVKKSVTPDAQPEQERTMARGRPKLSDEEKARRKAEKEARKHDPRDAVLAMWQDPIRYEEELITKHGELSEAAKDKTSLVKAHLKSTYSQLRLDPIVGGFVLKLLGLAANRRSRCVRQFDHILKTWPVAMDPQRELPLHPAGSMEPDDGKAAFDATGSGAKQAAERGDDPGRAQKRKSNAAPLPMADTGRLSTEDALAAFTANLGKLPAKARADETACRAAFEKGRADFCAGKPGIVPAVIAGKGEQDSYLAGWDAESVASSKAKQDDEADLRPRFMRQDAPEPASAAVN